MVDRLHSAYLNFCYHWFHKRVTPTWPVMRRLIGWCVMVAYCLFLASCQLTWIVPLLQKRRG